ncbi:MAG: hypothetical protein KME60_22520 [Cyanomargarita calcarea GSE-NOS-MK-12-04C]|jgi:hypothetical protein|uniref:Uncharacterized protein n=1 Tax=Cyanomargarita calcarea GSE-NOS-MK-12-04C TaxID=2839659 RepID=A0A951UUU0_9CYAN|nr:hypothetical protein [Cyanomargarita calcarea GSE-NOS-MK-12-04C]
MRVTISLLVTSLVLGSLAFEGQVVGENFTDMLRSFSGSESLLSASPKPNKRRQPAPHRGSGRRELLEYAGITYPLV